MRHAVIAITGHRCAGKSTVAEVLRHSGHSVLDMGALLGPLGFRHWFNSEPLPVRFVLDSYGGGHSVFPLFAGFIRKMVIRRRILFIDSAKTAADMEALARIVPGAEVQTLFLDCSFVERHRRYAARGREQDRGADALLNADETLQIEGFEQLCTRASWRIETEDGGAAGIDEWLGDKLPRFLRDRRIAPARRPPFLPQTAVKGRAFNALFAPMARDALHQVATAGPLANDAAALEAALADAARAQTDWQRLNAIRLHERALRETARPMRRLFPAYERAMRDRLSRGMRWRGRPSALPSGPSVLASPFLASLTPLLIAALGAQRRNVILAASAEDAAGYGRLCRLAAERMEWQR